MNLLSKSSTLLAAGLLAFTSAVKAQLVTYQTVTAWNGSVTSFDDLDGTLAQTFTNVSAVKSMTFNFFTGSTATATTISASFGEWNSATNSFIGAPVSFGTVVIPASNTWSSLNDSIAPLNNTNPSAATAYSWSQTFDLTGLISPLINATYGYLTDYTKTYAMVLTDTNGGTGLGLGTTVNSAFAYGKAEDIPFDYTFSQIVVAPGNQVLTPIPESSTVAAIAASTLVAALVGFRLRQRRQAVQPEIAIAA